MESASRCRVLVGLASGGLLLRFTFGGFEWCTTPEKQEGVMATWPRQGVTPLYFMGDVSTVFFFFVAYGCYIFDVNRECRCCFTPGVGTSV